ncbi:MAG: hypothetical protein HY815_03355 [Candidatus Riflebacteria bacterium]|nr:hypothetical protein [Candidatus Riflebacteria bacterium]
MRTLGPLVLAVALLALPALGAPRAVPPASPVDASTARARTDASAALPHTARGFPLRGAGAFLLTAQQREEMARRWAISWHPARSGVVVFCPRWARAMSNLVSSHGSPWDHDTHIPLIFHGPGHIRPGLYRAAVRPVDIFPTLSRLLHRQLDPTLPGRVLSEALVDAARPPRVILTVVLDQVSHTVLKENLQSLPVLAGLIAHGARFDSTPPCSWRAGEGRRRSGARRSACTGTGPSSGGRRIRAASGCPCP